MSACQAGGKSEAKWGAAAATDLDLELPFAAIPVIVKTGAGQKRAQISLSYLLNKDLRKVEPNENEGNTHLPVVGW